MRNGQSRLNRHRRLSRLRQMKSDQTQSIGDAPSRIGHPRRRAATAALLAVLPLGALTARSDGVELVLTPSLVSQYMFRGVRLGGLSFQPSVEADLGNGALGVWSNFPLMDKVDGVSDPEIDPYGSYTFAINASLSIAPGFTVYTYPNADTSAGSFRSTFEPYLAVNYAVAGVNLTPKLYYDLVLGGPTLELSATYGVPLRAAHTTLGLAATVGTYEWGNSAKDASP
ncbi:MAG TPA: TorF family putative porin, partial [Candidatus Sulfotelmatobacter sp.]|nr:TorF family putative porin [Candidatus Sulfotelmatobacter sp.]